MSESPPALVLIHNHRFEGNLDRLDQLYGKRFRHLHHLMPFYTGTRPNVHRAYEASHQFQGFVAQSVEALLGLDCSHYIFCGDDALLNPHFDENNLVHGLRMDGESAYIKGITPLADVPFSWPHAAGALLAFIQNTGVEWQRELPTAADAAKRFAQHGFKPGDLRWRNFRSGVGLRQTFQLLFYALKQFSAARGPTALSKMPYPLANSYSDFFIVPRASFREFAHLCGIFAAMNLFAEVAIPTALLLTCSRVVEEKATAFRGVEFWEKDNVEEFEAKSDRTLVKLLATFPPEVLYFHPVKLSRWT